MITVGDQVGIGPAVEGPGACWRFRKAHGLALGGQTSLEDHWGALSCLSDDAVTPLLNFVMGSGKDPELGRGMGRESIRHTALGPKPTSRPRKAGRRRRARPEHNTLKALLEQKASPPPPHPRGNPAG